MIVYHSFTCPRGVLQIFLRQKALPTEFEAIWHKYQSKYLYQLCARPFEEDDDDDEEEEEGEIGVLPISRMSF